MKYKTVNIDEGILQRAKAALEEVATARRKVIFDEDGMCAAGDHPGLEAIQQMESDARDIHWILGDLSRQPSKDEELEALDRLIVKISKAAGYGAGGENRAGEISRYFESIRQDRDRAYELWATFANEMRVQILSLKFIANSMLHCGTHREKANVLAVLLDAFRAVEQSICQVDGDPNKYDFYHGHDHNEGNWSFRDLLAEKQHLAHKLKRVQDELLAAQNGVSVDAEEKTHEHDLESDGYEDSFRQRLYGEDEISLF